MSTDNHSAILPGQSTGVHPGAQPFWLPGGETGVLLIHGFGGSIGDLKPLAADLQAAGYSVFGMRLAGHGQTPAVLNRTGHQDWRESVFLAARFVQSKTARFIVIGVSFGGAMAIDYLAHQPAKAVGLVTVNTPLRYRKGGRFQKLGLQLLRLFTPYYRKPDLTPEDHARYQQTGSLSVWPIQSIFETYTIFERFTRPALPRVIAPTLVITTVQDEYVDTKSADLVLNRLGTDRRRKLVLESSKHRPWLDPVFRQRMVSEIQDFFAPVLAE